MRSDLSLAKASYLDLKAMLDILFAFCILVVTLPIMLVCALLIKGTSRGPVFYRQPRVGKDGKIFNILKLRTMRDDAEAETGPVWARHNDTRITLVGRFLRKSHLDELPQMINVLKGDMSLVGPRPERPIFVHKFNERIPQYYKRLSIKPGVTGLAQVRYKYDETLADVRQKLAYDILYIKRMCWYLDLTIIFLTIGKILDKGAR
jgi:lipopolysaccharide/colanic/teichoic acid biosynthesis glycosyltransferase